MKDVKIKICGLKRMEDIAYANRYQPDYVGFIINFPKSHRSKTPQEVEILSRELSDSIQKVGVFVDEPAETPITMANQGIIDVIQLHGNEDEDYIQTLRSRCRAKIIKAFTIRGAADIRVAKESSADYVLLDQGKGSGQVFDWSWIPEDFGRAYFLAGGLTPENIDDAYGRLHPWAMDISSGVETNQQKDEGKIKSILDWRNEKEGNGK